MPKRRLGKGIDALLEGRDLEQLSNMHRVLFVEIDKFQPNPNQPRTRFNDDALRELADSIREKGIIQPILAEDLGDGSYTIIAGERRYRAARIAGLTKIPVIPQEFSDDEKLEIALVENLQREDLNPIDEAKAMDHAMRNAGYTQEEIARRLGKSRPTIANSLRLLKLDAPMQKALAEGEITAGHARAILALPDSPSRNTLFSRIRAEGLTVRQAEAVSQSTAQIGEDTKEQSLGESDEFEPSPVTDPRRQVRSLELKRLEDELVKVFGTKVFIRGSDQKGRIEIAYYSTADLDRLIEVFGVSID